MGAMEICTNVSYEFAQMTSSKLPLGLEDAGGLTQPKYKTHKVYIDSFLIDYVSLFTSLNHNNVTENICSLSTFHKVESAS